MVCVACSLRRHGPTVGVGLRCISTALLSSEKPPGGIVELRDYTLHASEFKRFVALSKEYADARSDIYSGFLGMFTADTGGNVSRVVHLYHFEDFNARDAARKAAAANARWQQYTDAARSCILTKESTIFRQAPPDVCAAAGISCASSFGPIANAADAGLQVVYELRNYRLRPGRNGVKELLSAFKTGLPAKLAADGVGQLALLGYADVGLLNQVVEICRYPSAQHLIEACERSRSAAEWHYAKALAYSLCRDFSITFMHPTAFSPWR